MPFSLIDLETRIASRATALPEKSHTAALLSAGPEKCAQKFGEEAVETIIASLGEDKNALIGEGADLLYHFLVLMRASGVSLAEIMNELERRTSQSGIAEKASR